MIGKNLSRRGFIQRVGALGGAMATFSIVPRHTVAQSGSVPPSEKLTKALIGFGGIAQSGNHLGLTATDLLAVCDPDLRQIEKNIIKKMRDYFKQEIPDFASYTEDNHPD